MGFRGRARFTLGSDSWSCCFMGLITRWPENLLKCSHFITGPETWPCLSPKSNKINGSFLLKFVTLFYFINSQLKHYILLVFK